MSNATKSSSAVLVVSALVGLLVGVGLVGGGGMFLVDAAAKRARRNATRGWVLTPVAVAARELAPGDLLTADAVVPGSAPEQFVTPQIIRPNATALAIGQVVTVPIAANTPLRWTWLAVGQAQVTAVDTAAFTACVDALRSRGAWPTATTSDELRHHPRAPRGNQEGGAE